MSRPKDIMVPSHSQPIHRSNSASTSTTLNSNGSNTNTNANTNTNTNTNHAPLAVNEHAELDWRYLSTTEAYSSEYSAPSEEDDEDEPIKVSVGTTHHQHRGQGTRPLLAPVHSSSSVQKAAAGPAASSRVTSGLFATSPGAAHEADDSTDTIKSMRARALDKINGRKASSSSMSNSYNANHDTSTAISSNSNGANIGPIGGTKRATIAASATQGFSYSPSRSSVVQDERGAPRESGLSTNGTSTKAKRRSFGLSTTDRSPAARINRVSQPEAHNTVPVNQLFNIRKRSSGSFKSQQVFTTSEDEPETARTRNATEAGGMLVSELKALKARVQELEMERMNRSLAGLHVQNPETITSPSFDRLAIEEQPSLTHSEKLQNIIQRHRGSAASIDSSNPLRSPVPVVSSTSRDRITRQSVPGATSSGSARLEPSPRIDGPLRNVPTPSSHQPTTQHVVLLQEALKTFEKAMLAMGGANGTPAVQSMSKVVSNVVNINQTIRTWIKADVALIDSSSMTSLQRACDEQIRSLTESLLAMATMQSAADRSLAQSDIMSGAMVMGRPYSPRMSTGSLRFAQGQRRSLAGTMSSRESSPPQENVQGSRQHRYAPTMQNSQPLVESPRAMQSPHHMSQSPGPEGSPADVSAHLARRQASVRNIMARYSHMSPRSPAFGQPSQDHDMVLDSARYENGLDAETQYEGRAQHGLDRYYQPSLQNGQANNHMSSSVEFSSAGHARAATGSRRPLSQQDQYSFSSGSRIVAPLARQGVVVQRSGRYAHDKVFSEDESIGGWGTMSMDQFPQQSKIGNYAARLQQLRGRHQQLQPLHQQLEQFENSEIGQEQYEQHEEQQQQHYQHQHRHVEYSDGAETDVFTEGQIPRFAQRRQPYAAQRSQQQQQQQQYQDLGYQKHAQRQSLQNHHLNHDMMMTTPAMPSPNSSPSSSSRLDAPSVVSSNSHQGGLAGVESRYHLSPRGSVASGGGSGSAADVATFPRQPSMSSISGFSDDNSNQFVQHQQQQQKRMSQALHRAHLQQQPPHLDGLSPQAQARLQQILGDS